MYMPKKVNVLINKIKSNHKSIIIILSIIIAAIIISILGFAFSFFYSWCYESFLFWDNTDESTLWVCEEKGITLFYEGTQEIAMQINGIDNTDIVLKLSGDGYHSSWTFEDAIENNSTANGMLVMRGHEKMKGKDTMIFTISDYSSDYIKNPGEELTFKKIKKETTE